MKTNSLIEEKNKAISQFMGKPDHIMPELMKYNSSWDWQIPAWYKVVRLSQSLAGEDKISVAEHNSLMDRYEKAVHTNDPERGFNIICEFLNTHTTI